MNTMTWRLYLTLMVVAVMAGGCTTVRQTDPPRTATEQFLMTQAAALAVQQLSVEALRGRGVFVDGLYFETQEKQYMIGEVRAKLLEAGARLVETREQAEIIVEVRSQGVGIDRYGVLFGFPPIPIPTGAFGTPADTVVTPELSLFKNVKQLGYASVAVVAYWRDTGEIVATSGPFVGKTLRQDWWFFGIGPRTVGNVVTTDKDLD